MSKAAVFVGLALGSFALANPVADYVRVQNTPSIAYIKPDFAQSRGVLPPGASGFQVAYSAGVITLVELDDGVSYGCPSKHDSNRLSMYAGMAYEVSASSLPHLRRERESLIEILLRSEEESFALHSAGEQGTANFALTHDNHMLRTKIQLINTRLGYMPKQR